MNDVSGSGKPDVLSLPRLKVLSSKMDPAEIRFIQKEAHFKERGVKVFRKTAHPPSCESPLKFPFYFVQLFTIWKQISNVGMKFIMPLG